jgi:hypothetical protein
MLIFSFKTVEFCTKFVPRTIKCKSQLGFTGGINYNSCHSLSSFTLSDNSQNYAAYDVKWSFETPSNFKSL